MPATRNAPDWTPPAALVEQIGDAIYGHVMPDGDQLSVLIHESDYVPYDLALPQQIEWTKEVCRQIGRTALSASGIGEMVRMIERLIVTKPSIRLIVEASALLTKLGG
jgi:hypothetical protein